MRSAHGTGLSGIEIEATFVRTDGVTVDLLTADGKMITTQFKSLGSEDRTYIRKILEVQRAAMEKAKAKEEGARALRKLVDKCAQSLVMLSYKERRIDRNMFIVYGTVSLLDNEKTAEMEVLPCWMSVETSDDGKTWALEERSRIPSASGKEGYSGITKEPAKFKLFIRRREQLTKDTHIRVTLQDATKGKPLAYVTEGEYKQAKAAEASL